MRGLGVSLDHLEVSDLLDEKYLRALWTVWGKLILCVCVGLDWPGSGRAGLAEREVGGGGERAPYHYQLSRRHTDCTHCQSSVKG